VLGPVAVQVGGKKQNRDACVYHALSDQRNLFCGKGAAACGAPDRDRHVGQPGRQHYHWDIPPMRGRTAIHPFAVRSLPNLGLVASGDAKQETAPFEPRCMACRLTGVDLVSCTASLWALGDYKLDTPTGEADNGP
jgi:hypothetical protein